MSDDSDEMLLSRLADVLARVAGPPPAVVEQSRELFTWRSVDAELAELTHDSQQDAEPVGMRSVAQPRTLTFDTGALQIEVELEEGPDARRLVGQLIPAVPATVRLRTPGGHGPPAVADELGRFVLELPTRPAPLSLRCALPDGTSVETSWQTV